MIDPSDEKLICQIYEGITDPQQWRLALEQVAGLAGAVGAGLGMQDMTTHAFRGLGDFGIDLSLSPTYRRLAATNTIWREIGRRRQPLTDRLVMPKAKFLRTELYADWFAPQGFGGVMACPMLFKGKISAVLVAFGDRARDDFEIADLARLGRFADHFGRALSIALDRERMAAELKAANLIVDNIQDSIFLVNRTLQLQYLNQAGKMMLQGDGFIGLCEGRIEIGDRRAHAIVAEMVRGSRGGELPASASASRAHPLLIQVYPCPQDLGGAGTGLMIVRIKDINRNGEAPTAERLRARMGLSPQQSAVMAELARGSTEAAVAEKLGIKLPTVHTYVRRVYDKFAIRSRAELSALLAKFGFDANPQSGSF